MKQVKRHSVLHDPKYRNMVVQLVAIRKRLELTQAEFAKLLQTRQPEISKIERFERKLDVVEFIAWLEVFSEAEKTNIHKIWKEMYDHYCESD